VSIQIRNNFFTYPHWATNDDYKIENTGNRINDCWPTAIRNIYQFYKVKCPLMHYDFLEAGYILTKGIKTSKAPDFLTKCGISFETKVAKDKEEYIENIKTIVLSKKPVLAIKESHVYLIIDVFKRNELINKYLEHPPVNYTLDKTKAFLNKLLEAEDADEFFECWNYVPARNSLNYHRSNPFQRGLITRKLIREDLKDLESHRYKKSYDQKDYTIFQINDIFPSFRVVAKSKYRFTKSLDYYINDSYSREKDDLEYSLQECFKLYQDCLDPSTPKHKFEETCFVLHEIIKFLKKHVFCNRRCGKESKEKFIAFRKSLFQ